MPAQLYESGAPPARLRRSPCDQLVAPALPPQEKGCSTPFERIEAPLLGLGVVAALAWLIGIWLYAIDSHIDDDTGSPGGERALRVRATAGE